MCLNEKYLTTARRSCFRRVRNYHPSSVVCVWLYTIIAPAHQLAAPSHWPSEVTVKFSDKSLVCSQQPNKRNGENQKICSIHISAFLSEYWTFYSLFAVFAVVAHWLAIAGHTVDWRRDKWRPIFCCVFVCLFLCVLAQVVSRLSDLAALRRFSEWTKMQSSACREIISQNGCFYSNEKILPVADDKAREGMARLVSVTMVCHGERKLCIIQHLIMFRTHSPFMHHQSAISGWNFVHLLPTFVTQCSPIFNSSHFIQIVESENGLLCAEMSIFWQMKPTFIEVRNIF